MARVTLRLGAFDYIAKPYEIERLRQVVPAGGGAGGFADADEAPPGGVAVQHLRSPR